MGFIENDDCREILVLAESILHSESSLSVPVDYRRRPLICSLRLIKPRVHDATLISVSRYLWWPVLTLVPHRLSWHNLLSLISIISSRLIRTVKLIALRSETLAMSMFMGWYYVWRCLNTEWGKVAIKELIDRVICLSQKALGRHPELVKFDRLIIIIYRTKMIIPLSNGDLF